MIPDLAGSSPWRHYLPPFTTVLRDLVGKNLQSAALSRAQELLMGAHRLRIKGIRSLRSALSLHFIITREPRSIAVHKEPEEDSTPPYSWIPP